MRDVKGKGWLCLWCLLLTAALEGGAKAERSISAEALYDKTRGMWLGQLIGNRAGRATEGQYQSVPNPDPNVSWLIMPDPNGWDADDDTDIEYIALHILENDGFDCTGGEIGDQWRDHMTSWGTYIANRQGWYLMGDGYLPGQTGSRTYNEHWYSIDSQITTEVLGAVCPGLAQEAIDLAGKFGSVSNEGFALHAAQLYASMYAAAFFEPNVVVLVTEGLKAIPMSSRTHRAVSDVLSWYFDDANDGVLDWRATRQKIYECYQGGDSYGRYYNWVESTVNTAATILALLYGQGDFKQTVQIGVLAGWDCDCNPATAGGLLGTIGGYSGLPDDLTDPNICGNVYQNVYRPYLPDPNEYRPQYDSITNVAARITALAKQTILANGGYITFDLVETYHLPDANEVVAAAEKDDPDGPAGLVAAAQAAGITVVPTAAVSRYDSTWDRHNLYAIVDGITDNTHNGHKAYYSYHSDPKQRPERDWYQLNFSQPVKFEEVTFYEGDIIWGRINTYYKDDANARGGFFNDLTVEILRDGQFVEPAQLQMTPELDRYQMYQTISFSFAPTVGDGIRIIGRPGGTESYTTIMELAVGGDIDPGLYVVSVEVAEGQEQRSCVGDVAIEFSRDVGITSNDVELAGTTNGTVIEREEVDFLYDSTARRLTLTFDVDNDANFSDTLPDDTYELKLYCAAVTDANDLSLLDDDDNPNDGYYTVEFHRLFGDADGSGAVGLADLGLLAAVWLDFAGQTGLDGDANGWVDGADLALFGGNWRVDYR